MTQDDESGSGPQPRPKLQFGTRSLMLVVLLISVLAAMGSPIIRGEQAASRGFVLVPRRAGEVVVLARPVEEEHAAVLAFLADGESWSSSALALALGASQRTVQRALDSLAAAGKVQSFGRARARRWVTPPVPGFTTTLLLPAPLSDG